MTATRRIGPITGRKRPPPNPKKAEAEELYEDGCGPDEISRLVGVTRPTIDRWIRDWLR